MLANGVFLNSNRYMSNKSNKRERERERETDRQTERQKTDIVHNFCSITLFALREFYTWMIVIDTCSDAGV